MPIYKSSQTGIYTSDRLCIEHIIETQMTVLFESHTDSYKSCNIIMHYVIIFNIIGA